MGNKIAMAKVSSKEEMRERGREKEQVQREKMEIRHCFDIPSRPFGNIFIWTINNTSPNAKQRLHSACQAPRGALAMTASEAPSPPCLVFIWGKEKREASQAGLEHSKFSSFQ